MIKVGLTGGIGSGKTFVCRVFQNLGIPVFSADPIAKRIISDNQNVKNQLRALLGASIYLQDGSLDRKEMASIIFNDSELLSKVNSIVHPAVRIAFNDWCNQQNSPYVIQEAAILFESGQQQYFDHLIAVTAPMELRISRVIKRDNISRSLVEDRIKNQLPDEYKIGRSNFCIDTNDQTMVLPQILNIHNRLKNYGKVW